MGHCTEVKLCGVCGGACCVSEGCECVVGCVVCLWGVCESVRGREMYCVVPHSHLLWTLVCPLSLLQGTIKLTFADQHSQQTDHLDATSQSRKLKYVYSLEQ